MELDLPRCKMLNDWFVGIGLPPDITAVWAEAHVGDPGYYLFMSAPDQPDVEINGEAVAGGVSVYIGAMPLSRNGLVVDIMTALGVRALHEAFEWVKPDGVPLANPHPPGLDQMWGWLSGRMRAVVGDYVNLWPGHIDWWAHVTDWDGNVVYDGPSPCPDELCTITPAMAMQGQMYCFDMTPIIFDGCHPSDG